MSDQSSSSIWNTSFTSLFCVQFCGAVNDQLFKSALAIMWTLMPNDYGVSSDQMLMLAAIAFIMPFMLFSSWAGKITALVDKVRWIRLIKLIEVAVMVCAAIVISADIPFSSTLLLILLFLMGTQSTLFGPVKYSLLPQITRGHSLIRANATIEGSTFAALILGMLTGTALMEAGFDELLCLGLLLVSAIGLLVALKLPFEDNTEPVTASCGFIEQIRLIGNHPVLVVSIMVVSWFWSIASVMTVELPFIVVSVLDAPLAITLFMVAFVVGIIVGNYTVAYLSRRLPDETVLSFAIIAYVVMGLLLLGFAGLYGAIAARGALSFAQTSDIGAYVPVMLLWLNLLAMTTCAGIFSIPIFTRLFHFTRENQLTLVIGQNNFWNAVAIIVLSLLVLMLLSVTELPVVLVGLGVVHFLLLPLVFMTHPERWQRLVLRGIFRVFYRAKVSGLQHYPVDQKGLLIACNHVSFLDAPLLLAYLPHTPVFVIDRVMMARWWVKMWLGACEVYPIEPDHPYSLKAVVRLLEQGKHVVIFPEGAISYTGRLGKIYSGTGVAAHRARVPILGARIEGLAGTHFGRLPLSPRRLFAPVTLEFFAPLSLDVSAELSRNARRRYLTEEIEFYLRDMMFQGSGYRQHLFSRLVRYAREYGLGREVIDDITGVPMTYKRLLLGSLLLGRRLSSLAPLGAGVGVLLPNAQAVAATFFALQAYDRIAVMLNFTAGMDNVRHAVRLSGINAVVTSRRFVDAARLETLIEGLSRDVRIVYLEDIRGEISFLQKLSGLWSVARLPREPKMQRDPEQTAVILFTSGSEGMPKGVALSHANIASNISQALSVTDIHTTDRLFNPLPAFHCFGLVAGLILPLFAGARSFQFPSPLLSRQIAELVYHWRATVLFGADSFLRRYAEVAHVLDMSSLRLVVAGAEKLKTETSQVWHEKFGHTIYQGYGVTETSPVIAVNTPRFHRPGSVGMPLPGIECRLQPVAGMEEEFVGVLEVRGPNVMQGYLLPDAPAKLVPPEGGWYNTGDIVRISGQGYITILGRQKRFAKIAGEMVGLDRVELIVQELWPETSHATLALPDPRRGEQIVLITTQQDASKEQLIAHWSKHGHNPLSGPGRVEVVKEIPLLATGKVDYVCLKRDFVAHDTR